MSQEEQDQIYGRLKREEREANNALAALSAKITDAASHLEQSAAVLRSAVDKGRAPSLIHFGHGSASDLTILVREFGAQRATVENIQVQLRRFDAPPLPE